MSSVPTSGGVIAMSESNGCVARPNATSEALSHYWHPVARSTEVADKPFKAKLLDQPLVLWRSNGRVAAFYDLCIHRGTPLSLGWVDGGELVCGYHGWRYGSDGSCTRIPSLPPDRPIPAKARANALNADLARYYGASRCRVTNDLEFDIAAAHGVVNATPVGMRGFLGNPVPISALAESHWAADVIYTPIETEFLKAAAAKGACMLNGGGMCVHQAVEAFQLLTGIEPNVARMHRAFATALAARDKALAEGIGPRLSAPTK